MSDEQKIWTYKQMKDKVREDADLEEDDPDETFVTATEMIGYFNEAIDEAKSEIMALNEDYFLTSDYMPLVAGQSEYDMPANIMADKIRDIIYSNGTTIYAIKRFKMYNKFEQIALARQYNSGAFYEYFIRNDRPGARKMVIIPPARETAVLPPLDDQSTPVERWYIRDANRVPLPGDYTNPEKVRSDAVDIATNRITVEPIFPYVTGDALKFSVVGDSVLPAPLVAGTVYYAIRISDTIIKLATTEPNADLGLAIDLTDVGEGFFTIRVAATDAIIDATIIDIPEYSTFLMEWVKANCLFKDGDPRLTGCVAKLEQQRKTMVDSLTIRVPDNDDVVAADFSSYNEMN